MTIEQPKEEINQTAENQAGEPNATPRLGKAMIFVFLLFAAGITVLVYSGILSRNASAAGAPRRTASPGDQFGSSGPALSHWKLAKNSAGPLTTSRHRPPLLGGLSPRSAALATFRHTMPLALMGSGMGRR